MPSDPRVTDAHIMEDGGAGRSLAVIETQTNDLGPDEQPIANEYAEAESALMRHAAAVLNRAYPGYLPFWKIEADIKHLRGIRITMPAFLPPNWGYTIFARDLDDRAIRNAGGVLLEIHRLARGKINLDHTLEMKKQVKAPFLKKPFEV